MALMVTYATYSFKKKIDYLEGWGFFYKIETIQIEVTMFFSFQGFQSLAVGWI